MSLLLFVFSSTDDFVVCLSDTIGCSVSVSKDGARLEGSGTNIVVAQALAVVDQQHCESHDGGTAATATAAVSNSVIQGRVGSIYVAETHPTDNAVPTSTEGSQQQCRAAQASSLSGNGAKEFNSPVIAASSTTGVLKPVARSELGVCCSSKNMGGKLICFPSLSVVLAYKFQLP